MGDTTDAIKRLAVFRGASLAETISEVERKIEGADVKSLKRYENRNAIDSFLLPAALEVKRQSVQIDNLVHALGILAALPRIMVTGEVVEHVSLAAGNTGRKFDVETNKRVMEFKFSNWTGGPETIRQNAFFKDYFYLAEYSGKKERVIYVIGTELQLKFMSGGRAITSVLRNNDRLKSDFVTKYGERVKTVREYFDLVRGRVAVKDISEVLPELCV